MRTAEWALERSAPEPNTGCWIWLGAEMNGYASAFCGKRSSGGHPQPQPAIQCIVTAPPGYDRHHRCENKMCVNPGHLEVIPHGEHTLQHNLCAGRCCRCGGNDWYQRTSGKRECRPCTLERNRHWRARRKVQ